MSEKGANRRTYGERLCERYLVANGIEYQHEPKLVQSDKLIDFVVTHHEVGQILLEVKDIENGFPTKGFSQRDPYKAVRSQIKQGTKKFRDFEDSLCVLVIALGRKGFANITNPSVMLPAMYGDLTLRVPFDTQTGSSSGSEPFWEYASGKGNMVCGDGTPQNSRIAALISLVDYSKVGTDENHIAATVWENAYGIRHLPRDLFRGDMDAWWTADGEYQEMTFVGERRKALGIDKF